MSQWSIEGISLIGPPDLFRRGSNETNSNAGPECLAGPVVARGELALASNQADKAFAVAGNDSDSLLG